MSTTAVIPYDYSRIWKPDTRRLAQLCALFKAAAPGKERKAVGELIVDEMHRRWVFRHAGVEFRDGCVAWVRPGQEAAAGAWLARAGFVRPRKGRPSREKLGEFVAGLVREGREIPPDLIDYDFRWGVRLAS